MKKPDKPNAAAGAAHNFKQWLQQMPPNIGPNDAKTLTCAVELFTTDWIQLREIAHRKKWTLEETINEMLQHCSQSFQDDEARFLRQFDDDPEGADDAALDFGSLARN